MPADPLHTRLCDEYGCEYPIVAFSHTRDVIAAVTNAGGIGILGCSTFTLEETRTNLHWVKERVGDRPFGEFKTCMCAVPAAVPYALHCRSLCRLPPPG